MNHQDLDTLYQIVQDRLNSIDTRVGDLQRLVSTENAQLLVLKQAEAFVAALTNAVYDDSIRALSAVMNRGVLAAYSRALTIEMHQGIAGNRPTLETVILDGDKEPVSPTEAHGGGLSSILGFLIRVVIIVSTGSRRLLVLDEPFGAVSDDVLPALSDLLRSVVDDLDFQIILVTHQEALADAASKTYRLLSPGKIEQVE